LAESQTSVRQDTQTSTKRVEGLVRQRNYAQWFEFCSQQLQAAANLPDNWDSYGGLPTNSLSAVHASIFLEQLAKTVSVLQPMIAVNSKGNVCFEWDAGEWLMTVEITPRGIAKFYYECGAEEVEDSDSGAYSTIFQHLTRQ
jgi:hypothetical protein